MVALSKRTQELLERQFSAETDREAARRLIEEECAEALPLATSSTPEDLERIRFAALKLSEGDLRKLRGAVELAKVDWRDLLMNAGFGFDVEAHERWFDKQMRG